MSVSTRRARVMARSQKLGHCICDPRQGCPCELLRTRNVCQCAGERANGPAAAERPRLTQLVKNAGCASKVPPGELSRLLARLPAVSDPRLLVGSATADDAGVFQLRDDLCLVQTVDVFTPCVDDPYTFGRIAACNSLSDVYAMGGSPVTALSLLAYPVHTLGEEAVAELLRGGMDQLAEAGVVLVGGHSINDEEIKLGFAVTGVIDPTRVITNAGAQPGDALILTKPLGTGIVAFAAQMGRASPEAMAAAAASMTTLNRAAAEVMVTFGAHAATDVTGFGLLGHLSQVVRESGVTAEVRWPAVPLLPEVWEYAEQGMISGAAERNREYVADRVIGDVPDLARDVLCDPQTSGGLLFALQAKAADGALTALRAVGYDQAAVMGRITERSGGRIVMSEKPAASATPAVTPAAECCATPTSAAEPCCPDGHAVAAPAPDGAGAAFSAFMATALRPGALDVVQKELMVVALSVAVQCEPCLRTHLAKARAMGLTQPELEEAAWLGVMFGGCKAMMFWNRLRES